MVSKGWLNFWVTHPFNFLFFQSLRENYVCSIRHSSSWPSLNNVILFDQIFHRCPHLCSITSKCRWLHVHIYMCVCVCVFTCDCQCLSLLCVLFLFRHPVLLCFPSHSSFSLKFSTASSSDTSLSTHFDLIGWERLMLPLMSVASLTFRVGVC